MSRSSRLIQYLLENDLDSPESVIPRVVQSLTAEKQRELQQRWVLVSSRNPDSNDSNSVDEARIFKNPASRVKLKLLRNNAGWVSIYLYDETGGFMDAIIFAFNLPLPAKLESALEEADRLVAPKLKHWAISLYQAAYED